MKSFCRSQYDSESKNGCVVELKAAVLSDTWLMAKYSQLNIVFELILHIRKNMRWHMTKIKASNGQQKSKLIIIDGRLQEPNIKRRIFEIFTSIWILKGVVYIENFDIVKMIDQYIRTFFQFNVIQVKPYYTFSGSLQVLSILTCNNFTQSLIVNNETDIMRTVDSMNCITLHLTNVMHIF